MTDARVRYRQAPQVLWRRSFDGVLLLPRQGATPISLSGSGMDLWQLLEQPQSVETAAALLAERFGVDASAVATEIAPVIAQLVEQQIIEPVGA